MEFLYVNATASLASQAEYAKKRDNNPYRAEIDSSGRIHCGHHPFLVAQPVRDLTVRTEPETQLETISWHTMPVYRLRNGEIEMISEGKPDSFTRYREGAVSNEIMWDRMKGAFKEGFTPRTA